MKHSDCEYCETVGGELLWKDEVCRVVRVDDEDYSGLCRVIWFSHIREMTDLSATNRLHFMKIVFAVELALKETIAPLKINLACLGNVTPHLHWHVIPRFRNDRHFPKPIWALLEREAVRQELAHDWVRQLAQAIDRRCSAERV